MFSAVLLLWLYTFICIWHVVMSKSWSDFGAVMKEVAALEVWQFEADGLSLTHDEAFDDPMLHVFIEAAETELSMRDIPLTLSFTQDPVHNLVSQYYQLALTTKLIKDLQVAPGEAIDLTAIRQVALQYQSRPE